MTFQETLKELRAKKKITQKELAKLVGVSPVQLNRYENGTIRPRLPIIAKLAEVLEVEYSLLNNSLNPSVSIITCIKISIKNFYFRPGLVATFDY